MFLNAKNVYDYDPCLDENDVDKRVFVVNDLQSEQKRLYTDLWGHGLKQCRYKSRMVQLLYARCFLLLLIN